MSIKQRDDRNGYVKEWGATLSGCASLALSKAKFRAAQRGMAYELDEYRDEIQLRIELGRCELTGRAFDLTGKDKRFRPSIDRIESSKGYTLDNVRVVATCVNKMLQEYGLEFFLSVAEAIKEYQSK